MSGEAKLGWAGLALTFLGLPSTLLLFAKEYQVIGILSTAIVIGIIGGVWGMFWLLGRPSFTVLNIEKTLKFRDKDAHRVGYTDSRQVRANHKGLTEFWFKDVGAENAIEALLIDGKKPDLEETELEGRKKKACKRYMGGLQWRQRIEPTVSLEIKDSFPNQEVEYFTHKVMEPTKKVRVRLEFHEHKLPRRVEVFLGHGGDRGEPLKPQGLRRLAEGKVWVWERKKLNLGENYRIEWDW